MKKIVFFSLLAGALVASPVQAQMVDDFEDGNITGWTAGAGFPTLTHQTANGGANSTTGYLHINDAGFSVGANGNAIYTATSGNYKLKFYYQNGLDGNPIGSKGSGSDYFRVTLVQGTDAKAIMNLSTSRVDSWTLVESPIFNLADGPISIQIAGNTQGSDTAPYKAAFDQFELEPILAVPLDFETKPDDRVYLSRTRLISVAPVGGTAPYTVTFDVGNNGSVEHSDSVSPYEFNWDTLTAMPQDTSGTVELKITVTDSASASDNVVYEYNVDNEFDGRVSLFTNGDFSQWTDDVSNTTTNLPTGWTLRPDDVSATGATYGPGESYTVAAGHALQIHCVNNAADTTRFPLMSNGIHGNYRDLQATYWGKGTYCSLIYMISSDGGATFATSGSNAGLAYSSTWAYVVEDPIQDNNLGLNDTSTNQVAIAPHVFGTNEDLFWDDITVEGNLIPADSDVEGWNLY